MELSLCMIVRNEEKNLEACLLSVQDAVDEIIILDTGSVDATKDVARRFTQHVADYVWTDDFSAARNASMALATKPYILWLDADDVLEPAHKEKLRMIKDRLDGSVDAVMMPYHCAFDESGAPSLVFERERIVRRAAGFRFESAVHEAMAVSGNVIHEDIVIRHTGRHGEQSAQRNLAIYEKQLAAGMRLKARDWYYYARELKNCGRIGQAIQAFETFLAREDGWIENRIDACILLGECLEAEGETDRARLSYLSALGCVAPRAEALCAIGGFCMRMGEYDAAAVWYRAAMLTDAPISAGAFSCPAARDYIPSMQLCVCYDHLGDTMRAAQMNERALLIRPGDPAATANRAYFEKKLGEAEKTANA